MIINLPRGNNYGCRRQLDTGFWLGLEIDDVPEIQRLRLNEQLTRRSVLRAALTAGVGATALTLVGCSGDDEPVGAERELGDSRSDGSSQGQQDSASQAEAVSRPARPITSAQEDSGVGQGSAQARTNGNAARQQVQDPRLPQNFVDPVEWRERYPWRKLEALHQPSLWPSLGGTLTIEGEAVHNWNPLADLNPDTDLAQPGHLLPLVYSRLVELDVSDRSDAHRTLIQGDLATGWEWLDSTTISFQLRQGVTWPEQTPTEGRSLTAEDIALSYNAYREPGRRQSPAYEAVERIEATSDSNAVTFHLREPSAPLLNLMTSPWHVALPAELVTDPGSASLAQSSRGTGPFELKLSDGRSSWVIVRNPTYARIDADGIPLPYLDEVRGEDFRIRDLGANATPGGAKWAAWESGAAHAIQLDSVDDAERAMLIDPEARLQVTPPSPSGSGYFSFASLSESRFADVRVRTALSIALHRFNLAALVYGGLAASDSAQNWTFFRDPQQPDQMREWPWDETELDDSQRYDPNQALALLAAAGYSEDDPLIIRVDTPPSLNPAGQPYNAGAHSIANFVADLWEQHLPDIVNVRRLERIWTPFTDSTGRQWLIPKPDPAVDLGFQDPDEADIYDADADDLAYGAMHSSGRFNRAGINGPEIDEWAVAQRQALDPFERADLLERIRLKEQQQVWRVLLVNPYGMRVRRSNVFNLVDTYYAKSLRLAPDQLKTTWIDS